MIMPMGKTFFMSATASSSLPVWTQFEDLVRYMTSQGYSLSKELPADYLISMNYSREDYNSFIQHGGRSRNTALVLLEPQAVYPLQYKKRVLSKYSLILRPGHPAQYEDLGQFIGWPYEVNPNPLTPTRTKPSVKDTVARNKSLQFFSIDNWVMRNEYITMINSNKVSAFDCENYSLRREFAHSLDSKLFSLYGDLWNSTLRRRLKHRIEVLFFSLLQRQVPNLRNVYGNLLWRYPAAKGLISDKHKILQNTKFNIVIENDPSYVSEKIFDSMINGCIPLYSGPKIPTELIPLNSYITLPSNPRLLLKALESLKSTEIESILTSINEFISSPKFIEIWEREAVFIRIGTALSAHIERNHE
jgi:hypothetical protein